MIQRVYIDTSVIGGCYDPEFSEWSSRLFEQFKDGNSIAVISDITLEELELAPAEIRDLISMIPLESREYITHDAEVMDLADQYVLNGAITSKFYQDALHIAVATINRVDVLVSWNFKHIVNINRIRLYNSVNLKCGYPLIEIRNPREILTDLQDEER